jgi:hypothetical protein
MAYAMMGGIIVGTVLTLLFLPALYLAWFRVQPPLQQDQHPSEPLEREHVHAPPHASLS